MVSCVDGYDFSDSIDDWNVFGWDIGTCLTSRMRYNIVSDGYEVEGCKTVNIWWIGDRKKWQ